MSDYRRTMRKRISLVTCILHVPIFLLLAGLGATFGAGIVPYPVPVAFLVTLVLLAPTPFVTDCAMDDRPRTPWYTRVFGPIYFAHWCSAVGMFVPAVVLGLGRFTWDAFHGTFEIPTRTFLACYVAALALASWGVFLRRRLLVVREKPVAIRGLPTSFDGYRIAHLSDLHIGSMTTQATIDAWVERTNAADVDLVVLTGDYVTNGTAYHAEIAKAVGRLRARDGVYASMGNHDYFGEGQPLLGLLAEAGVAVLRNAGTRITRGDDQVYLAGIDDTWTKRADLDLALQERPSDTRTVLLAHDPATFDTARELDVDLVLSGHTHGGQIAMPFLARRVSLSHLAHTYHLGFYQHGASTLFVHPGLGTTGVPIRVGVAPAIAIHRLVAAPHNGADA